MAQKRRYVPGTSLSMNDWYFNIEPNTGSRSFAGLFEENDPNEQNVITRLINQQTDYAPATKYNNCVIDVSPGSVNGFITVDQDYQLMLSVETFTMPNCPRNINTELKNNYFWVMEDWNQSTTVLPSSTMWQKNWKRYTITPGYYPDQKSITDEMNKQSSDVIFKFDDATQLLTYNGTKPLLLAASKTFSAEFYKERPLIRVTNTFNTIPPQKSAGVIGSTPSTTIWDNAINFQEFAWKYLNPEYRLDSLASKLGYFSGSPDTNIHYYFGYSSKTDVPNTAEPVVTKTLLENQEGEIGIVLFPGAKSGPGNVYGAHNTCYIVCDEVATELPNQNIVGVINVGSEPAYTSFTNNPRYWMPLRQGYSLNKFFHFRLKDQYMRDYHLNSGIPFIELHIEARLST